MNWKYFLALPLAALLLGEPLHPPQLKPVIPVLSLPSCDYPAAYAYYLRAHAYARENPPAALKLLYAAERERAACGNESAMLASRIGDLRRALAP